RRCWRRGGKIAVRSAKRPQGDAADRLAHEPRRVSSHTPQTPHTMSQDPPPTAAENPLSAAAQRNREASDSPEEALWSGGYSHLAMVGTWFACGLASVIALLAAFALSLTAAGVGYTLLVVLAVWAFFGLLFLYRRYSVTYRLSTQRLIHEAGLLWRTVDRVELIDIDDVTYRQAPVERVFGVGTIVLASSDRTTPELAMPGIADVRRVADRIDDARRAERRSRGLHIETI
ncbi:MAG: PH domain-containing protein, partial [Planctomycetota bacterium]